MLSKRSKLKEAGFEEKQAEAVSEAFRDAQSETEPLTKKDLQIELATIQTDLTILKWMMGFIFAAQVMPLLAKLLA